MFSLTQTNHTDIMRNDMILSNVSDWNIDQDLLNRCTPVAIIAVPLCFKTKSTNNLFINIHKKQSQSLHLYNTMKMQE